MTEKAPNKSSPEWTQVRITALLSWLSSEASKLDGLTPRFSNAEAALIMEIPNMQVYGRAHGQIQSRIDFACYRCGFPPLGLAADEEFPNSWLPIGSWNFPIVDMRNAAQKRRWSTLEFDQILAETLNLQKGASQEWDYEIATAVDKIKAWAQSFAQPEMNLADSNFQRNPPWMRDELILALHLYMHNRDAIPSKSSIAVARLSRLLNRINSPTSKSMTYRNAAGVYMKLMNFRSIDPDYVGRGKVGLTRGNKDEKVVWDLFASDLKHLDEMVAAITSVIESNPATTGIDDADEIDIEDGPEGRVLTRLHRFKERNRALVELCKKRGRKNNGGKLVCAGCDLDFAIKYGEIADRLIDVHHTKPVHTLEPGHITKIDDLVLLCSSCHRAIHSQKQWLQVAELRAKLKSFQQAATGNT